MANTGKDRNIPAQQSDVDNVGSDMSEDLTKGTEESERIRGVGDEGEEDLEDEEDEIDEEEDEDGSF